MTSNAQDDTDATRPPDGDVDKDLLFWKNQLQCANQAGKQSRDAALEAYKEFVGSFTQEPTLKAPIKQPETKYPIFWASVKTIQPALYSSTPVTNVERLLDDLDDNIARLCTLGLDRLGKFLIRQTPFDRVQYATRDDYILAGKATNRVYFESDIGETVEKRYLVPQQPDPQTGQSPGFIDDEGNQYPPDLKTQQDEQGVYIEDPQETLDNVKVCLQPVSYDDILHTPNARHWEEIDWIAFKTLLTKDDVETRFSKEIADEIPYHAPAITADKDQKQYLPVKYATVWEIWDKRKMEVRWMCEDYEKDFLDVQPDPYELIGFFPCPPFIIGTHGRDNLYPTPDYVQLRPIIYQLHGLFRRFKTLVRAVRRRGLYDASVTELSDMANDADEAEWIGVNNFQQQITNKGGIENIIQWFPVETMVSAIQQMAEVFKDYEEKFNQIYGIPDILRGVSDPNETAAAQQQKGRYLSLRFSAVQREYQRLVRDDIELMIDLALKKFPQHKLAEIMGVRYWSPEDQANFSQVLLLLQDDNERKMRIDIETDSTITMDQEADLASRNELAQTLFQGLVQGAQAGQAVPGMIPIALELVMYVVRGTRDGKQIEQKLKSAIDKILAPQPPTPPPPDPKLLEVQRKQAKDQQDAQYDQKHLQIEEEKVQIDAQKIQVDAATEGQKVAIKGAELQQTGAVKAHELALDAHKQDFQERFDAAALQLEALHKKMQDFTHVLNTMRTESDAMKQSHIHKVENVVKDHAHHVELSLAKAKESESE